MIMPHPCGSQGPITHMRWNHPQLALHSHKQAGKERSFLCLTMSPSIWGP